MLALEIRVAYLESLISPTVLSVDDGGVLPCGRAGVLITRGREGISAQHIIVHHTPLKDAQEGIKAMRTGNVAFVQAGAAGVVLDALGVEVSEGIAK
jgi:hypothetical protein